MARCYHEGKVIEAFVAKKRNQGAALKFLKKGEKRYGRPKVILTDKLRSFRAVMKEIGNVDLKETVQWSNNRAENSHHPSDDENER